MSKYSLETKIKAVHDVLKLGMSSSAVALLNYFLQQMRLFKDGLHVMKN